MASSTFFTSSTPLEHPAEQIELKSYLKNLTESQVLEFFEVADCVKWIRELSAQRVALQFPDGFLIFARRIAVALEAETLAKTFVLADTSYRSCCIDEVAAAHATCDALIHFGEACLSAPTRNIPVRYVLGKMPIDLQHLKSTIDAQNLAPNSTVILTDSIYSHLETQITEIFGANSKMAQISNDASSSYLGRATWDFQEENLIFIGANDTPLLPLWILSYPNFTQVYHYDPAEKSMTQDR
ncbi:unnamed protein product [Caenorhabditis angaria]|uniref:2-(3-amino-3-carboxypropyl)histidine synthase subunit 2 n=1 Tax=Caenorhabditis angaria TaxID=860376 RepID=A0A9P1IEZ3_9PELO|nr:unnamed protein product [Caenorhabditis angaria]